ncbi:hypothetical protein K2173_005760 [Erythroxylum novogranatense]|uniref:Protein SDA1 n=1 Tax=Erythroxylum novogranatense TaxID=1862640 RepID=A0AAV8U5Q6_9ROSI|nr:hypothetical protein K2173_005760 [Erythroxylum novogranatense]
MIASISYLLNYEKIEDDDDASSSEDDSKLQKPQAIFSKEVVYKAYHKGTSSSKKKKKAKLERGFAEKLLSRLQTCNERSEHLVGLHQLILLNFHSFLEPHQRDITNLLCSEVPHDAVEPLFKQIVNQFVHDRSRPRFVRRCCLKGPWSPSDPKARPKAYGEVIVSSNVPDVELLQHDDRDDEEDEVKMEDSDGEEDSIDEDGDNDVDANDSDYDEEERVIMIRRKWRRMEANHENKRKLSDFDGRLILRHKPSCSRDWRLKSEGSSLNSTDAFLSNEDFQKSKSLSKESGKFALAQEGFKAHIRRKLTKEQRLAIVKAGREEREKYQSRTALKRKKLRLQDLDKKNPKQRRGGKQFEERKLDILDYV